MIGWKGHSRSKQQPACAGHEICLFSLLQAFCILLMLDSHEQQDDSQDSRPLLSNRRPTIYVICQSHGIKAFLGMKSAHVLTDMQCIKATKLMRNELAKLSNLYRNVMKYLYVHILIRLIIICTYIMSHHESLQTSIHYLHELLKSGSQEKTLTRGSALCLHMAPRIRCTSKAVLLAKRG